MNLKGQKRKLNKTRLRNLTYHIGLAFVVGGVLHGVTGEGPAPETAVVTLVGVIMALLACTEKEDKTDD